MKKIQKLEKSKQEKTVEDTFEVKKPVLPTVEVTKTKKPLLKNLEPLDFKRTNIKATIAELDKRSLARQNAEMLSLKESKKVFQQLLTESKLFESQYQRDLKQNFDEATRVYDKAQKVRIIQRLLEKKRIVNEKKAMFMQEYYSMLLE